MAQLSCSLTLKVIGNSGISMSASRAPLEVEAVDCAFRRARRLSHSRATSVTVASQPIYSFSLSLSRLQRRSQRDASFVEVSRYVCGF